MGIISVSAAMVSAAMVSTAMVSAAMVSTTRSQRGGAHTVRRVAASTCSTWLACSRAALGVATLAGARRQAAGPEMAYIQRRGHFEGMPTPRSTCLPMRAKRAHARTWRNFSVQTSKNTRLLFGSRIDRSVERGPGRVSRVLFLTRHSRSECGIVRTLLASPLLTHGRTPYTHARQGVTAQAQGSAALSLTLTLCPVSPCGSANGKFSFPISTPPGRSHHATRPISNPGVSF